MSNANISPIKSAFHLSLRSTDLDPFSIVCRTIYSEFVRDRFNYLNKYSPYIISSEADPVPTPFETTVPFSDIMDQMAIKIDQKATNGKIDVFWSGGVDSTGVVVALLKNINDKTKIRVHCTNSSLEEYPQFYTNVLIKQDIETIVSNNPVVTVATIDDCDVITSGWCADQLFGSDVHVRLPDEYNRPWLTGIATAYSELTNDRCRLTENSLQIIKDVQQGYARYLGLEINQFCEFAQLYNFGCKFSYVRDGISLRMPRSPNRDKSVAFYSDFDFQRWSIGNFDRLRCENGYQNPKLYKRPIKQYIQEYTGDHNYFMTKRKIASQDLANIPLNTQVTIRTDDGYKVLTPKNLGCENCMTQVVNAASNMFRKPGR